MSLAAAVGHASALDAREASAQAMRQALGRIGRQPVALGWVFSSHEFPIQAVLSGAAAVLGDAPLIGLSTQAEFSAPQVARRSVVVALLAGDALQARAGWWGGSGQTSQQAAQQARTGLPGGASPGLVFATADGVGGEGGAFCEALALADVPLAGGLAAGDLHLGRTYQIGGQKAGSGGVAVAQLAGDFRAGVGVAHGWRPVGAYVQVTRSQGLWVRGLDGRPASEVYARLFGYPAREWAFPPLNHLIRLYPLGLERENSASLQVCAPLRVEADGSLRMNTAVPEGRAAHLLVGSTGACQEAARQAVREARAALGDARPALAVVLVDAAWEALLEAQAGSEIRAVQDELGAEVPLAGGYTLGQFARSPLTGQGELLNQHIEVLLLAA